MPLLDCSYACADLTSASLLTMASKSASSSSEVVSSTRARPSSLLYVHVQESIFTFLPFRSLHRAGLVSRLWNRAVSSMRPISGELSERKLQPLTAASSPLDKHVGAVGTRIRMLVVSVEELRCISCRWTHVHTLHVHIKPKLAAAPTPLPFPPSLTNLAIQFTGEIAEVQRTLRAISTLPRIRCVELQELPGGDAVDLSCFHTCATLEELVVVLDGAEGQPSLSQIAQARAMSHLRVMSFWYLSVVTLSGLVQHAEGFAPKWQEVGTVPLTILTVTLLPRLPHLTSLCGTAYRCDLDFLAQMRELQSLSLALNSNNFPADRLAAAIGHCVHLHSVSLSDSALTSADLNTMLDRLPCLQSLSLTNAKYVDSLQPFIGVPCSLALTSLHLWRVAVPDLDAVGMAPLHGLRNLQRLVICTTGAGASPSNEVQSQFAVPSKLLPKLVHFNCSQQRDR